MPIIEQQSHSCEMAVVSNVLLTQDNKVGSKIIWQKCGLEVIMADRCTVRKGFKWKILEREMK